MDKTNKAFYCIKCKQKENFIYEEEKIVVRGTKIRNGDMNIDTENMPILEELLSPTQLSCTIRCVECDTRYVIPESHINNLSEISYVAPCDNIGDSYYLGTKEDKEHYVGTKWEEL